ncbi:YaaC family protein [Sulfoacidibacillus thermotolerans]|nr:YaaC family protein [Sulfoacidibacillus thermotolerans]
MDKFIHPFSLQSFENPLVVKDTIRFIHRHHEHTKPSFDSYYALSNSIRQMNILLTDAAKCSIRTRPILLYYALNHLAKAVIILTYPQFDHLRHVQKHGISIKTPKKRIYSYLEDIIRIEKHGTFIAWYEAMHDLYQLQKGLGETDLLPNDPSSIAGIQIQISELWSMVPQSSLFQQLGFVTQKLYADTIQYHNQKRIFILPRHQLAEWKITIEQFDQWIHRIDPIKMIETMQFHDEIIHLELDVDKTIRVGRTPFYFLNECESYSEILKSTHQTEVLYLIGPQLPWPYTLQHYFQEPFIHFILLFHLSMLSRYYPLEWNDIIGDETTLESISIQMLCKRTENMIHEYVRDLFAMH